MSDDRRYSAIVAIFAAVVYVALVVAAFGLISLFAGRDVMAGGISPLVGPSMTAAASLLVLALLVTIGVTIPPSRQRVAPLTAFGVGVAAVIVFVLVGGVLVGFGGSAAPGFLDFVVAELLSPYALAVGVFALIVTLCYQLVLHGRFRDRDRPRWPWEDDRSE